MELDIGKHCELETCRQLDYCPFLCHHCKKNFCLEHRTADSHECPSTKVKPLPVPEHKPTIIRCDICNAIIKNHIITPYKCPKCNINTCSVHRYLDAHQCKSLGKVLTGKNNPYTKLSENFVKSKNGGKGNNKNNRGNSYNTGNNNPNQKSNIKHDSNASPDAGTNINKPSNKSCFPCNILSKGNEDDKDVA